MKLRKLKKYSKKMPYSYVFGAIPTLELLKYRREQLVEVVFNPEGVNDPDYEALFKLCVEEAIPYQLNERAVNKIASKGNTYVVAVFEKYTSPVNPGGDHILLDRPRNPGNVGAIIRSMVGFGYKDLVVVGESVDIFNPALISATMGAFFQMNVGLYPTIGDYVGEFGDKRTLHPFLKSGKGKLGDLEISSPHTLAFGNESAGLGEEYGKYPDSIEIPHSDGIESLNLSVSASLAMWEAFRSKGQ